MAGRERHPKPQRTTREQKRARLDEWEEPPVMYLSSGLPTCAKCFKPPRDFALRIAHLQGAAQNGCDNLLDLSFDAKGHSSLPLLIALPHVSEV